MKIVLDSDVAIAGLISSKGAGRFILKNLLGKKQIQIITSLQQIKEIEKVLKNKSFTWKANLKFWHKFKKTAIKTKLNQKILKKNLEFVNDPKDNHILAICSISKTKFLLTYNLKDYKREKIKDKFDILVVRPGYFLQYWRLKKK